MDGGDAMELIHGGDWAGFEREYGTQALDFSANVSPLGLPERVYAAAITALETAERYPDPLCRELRAALADFHGVGMEKIVCGNGAADLIYRLCRVLRPKRAALFVPGFAEYALALRAEGCEPVELLLPEAADYCLTPDVAARVPEDCELLFLCNPNNPTGRLTERETLRALLRRCREQKTALVVDECFLDFCDCPSAHSLIGALGEETQLVILKAFTKTYAMAGLRLGYALCGSAALAERLQACGQPWAVSGVAQAAGLAALKETDYVNQLRALISSERRRMAAALTALGLRVIPGEANFLLFYAEDPALCSKLRARGILLRGCGNYTGLSANWYRAAVRTEKENDRLLESLGEVLHGG